MGYRFAAFASTASRARILSALGSVTNRLAESSDLPQTLLACVLPPSADGLRWFTLETDRELALDRGFVAAELRARLDPLIEAVHDDRVGHYYFARWSAAGSLEVASNGHRLVAMQGELTVDYPQRGFSIAELDEIAQRDEDAMSEREAAAVMDYKNAITVGLGQCHPTESRIRLLDLLGGEVERFALVRKGAALPAAEPFRGRGERPAISANVERELDAAGVLDTVEEIHPEVPVIDLAALAGRKVIEELLDIEVLPGGVLDLPDLEEAVGGIRVFDPGVVEIRLPRLRRIGRLYVHGPELATLDLPALEQATDLEVRDGEKLEVCRLPALITADEITLHAPQLRQLDLPVLASVGKRLWLHGGSPRELVLPSLTEIADLLVDGGPRFEACRLPALTTAYVINLGGPMLAEVALPALTCARGVLCLSGAIARNQVMTRVELPALHSVGLLGLDGLTKLTSFIAPLLERTEKVTLVGTRQLTEIVVGAAVAARFARRRSESTDE